MGITNLKIGRFILPNMPALLSRSRRFVRLLKIPASAFLAVSITEEKIDIFELTGRNIVQQKHLVRERNVLNTLISLIGETVKQNNIKIVAAEIIGGKMMKEIISDLWLKEDIVPFFSERKEVKEGEISKNYVKEVAGRFDQNDLVKMMIKENNEVNVAELVLLKDYQNISNPDEFKLLLDLAARFKDKKIVFINATPRGGGVALMRHALIRLYRLLGINAHWHILRPDKAAFNITKTKFHNILQAVADKDTILDENDIAVYDAWIEENAAILEKAYKDADVVVIDDAQPAGLVPYIKKANPGVKIIYRSHIQIVAELTDTPGTPQAKSWNFIWSKLVNQIDLFVAHPMREFIPENVRRKKTVLMPATTDGLDGLNKPLTPQQTDYYLKLFNKILLESGQQLLDRNRPYIIQIARFDPSKGIPDVVEAYRMLCLKLRKEGLMLPQLVICGHGSIDDPDGIPVLNNLIELLKSEKYKNLAADIKVARLRFGDQILNALLTESKVALQLSHKEGFEVKVTEALMKGVPVVAYQAGGIPLQIKDGLSGFIVKKVGDVEEVAEKLYSLFSDQDLYLRMRAATTDNINPETTTVSNAINFLFLSLELLNNGEIKGEARNVKELIGEAI